MKDKELLKYIYDRMIAKHGENKKADYMVRLLARFKEEPEKQRVNFRDMNDPVVISAYELALNFSQHCLEYNFPPDYIINGVAYNAEACVAKAIEKAYTDGKEYERNRIAELLGVQK